MRTMIKVSKEFLSAWMQDKQGGREAEEEEGRGS